MASIYSSPSLYDKKKKEVRMKRSLFSKITWKGILHHLQTSNTVTSIKKLILLCNQTLQRKYSIVLCILGELMGLALLHSRICGGTKRLMSYKAWDWQIKQLPGGLSLGGIPVNLNFLDCSPLSSLGSNE